MGAALLSFVAMAALALLGRAATGGLPLSDRAQRALGWGGLGVAALLLLALPAALAATLAGLAAVLLIRAGPAPRGPPRIPGALCRAAAPCRPCPGMPVARTFRCANPICARVADGPDRRAAPANALRQQPTGAPP